MMNIKIEYKHFAIQDLGILIKFTNFLKYFLNISNNLLNQN